jgi:hypothetical protein
MKRSRRGRALWGGSLIVAVFLSGCDTAQQDNAVGGAAQQAPSQLNSPEEPPLQIHIPANLREQLSEKKQACWLREIENLIAQAGDPATLDPGSIEYLGNTDIEAWSELQPYMKRALLAQAITSEAITHC